MKPDPSMTTHSGSEMPVFDPPKTELGATFPELPPAKVKIDAVPELETSRLPEESNVSAVGPKRVVLDPSIVTIGATLPEAPGAKARIACAPVELKQAPQFAAYSVPDLSKSNPSTPVSPVFEPVIVRAGEAFPFALGP